MNLLITKTNIIALVCLLIFTPSSFGAKNCIPGSQDADVEVPEESTNLSYITDFGLELFKELFPYNSTDRNFFFSPYSVWSSLSLAYFGSAGETESQIGNVLKVSDKVTALKKWKTVEFL